ncbi:MAG: NADH-quinone oxidoreductase subunit A [Dehalococcoidia bacterium]|nr:NADH-quinone oxidoreductase subunit A [Dehalococcoidia bacterium]
MLAASWLGARFGLRPQRPTSVKLEMYECGMEPIGGKWIQFNFRYYLFALLFLVFDVLGVLLYPWAVELRNLGALGLGWPALGGVMVFVGLVTVGWVYAWKKKGLEWR